jgi:hypothetical protein
VVGVGSGFGWLPDAPQKIIEKVAVNKAREQEMQFFGYGLITNHTPFIQRFLAWQANCRSKSELRLTWVRRKERVAYLQRADRLEEAMRRVTQERRRPRGTRPAAERPGPPKKLFDDATEPRRCCAQHVNVGICCIVEAPLIQVIHG